MVTVTADPLDLSLCPAHRPAARPSTMAFYPRRPASISDSPSLRRLGATQAGSDCWRMYHQRQPLRRREGAWLVLCWLGCEAATIEVEAWARSPPGPDRLRRPASRRQLIMTHQHVGRQL